MRKLSETVAHLAAIRTGMAHAPFDTPGGRLQALTDFGSNPGNLAASVHLPARWAESRALVVVLHGCTQTAAGYDHGSGWSRLADEHGFALLFAEQRRTNNPNLCFNWFSPQDTARDSGEALSIRQMVAAVVDSHAIDPTHIFVTGLSAGGAMTSVMLATYPELFAGGAIIAGIAYGIAANMSQALEAMGGRGAGHRAADLAAPVRGASGHEGRWPTVSVWQGTADTTVSPANADAILAQWLSIHGIAGEAIEQEMVAGHPRRVWRDKDGRAVIEDYRITGMGHGTPLATSGEAACGATGPHMLEAGISSTRRIAAHWGLTGSIPAEAGAHPDEEEAIATQPATWPPLRPKRIPTAPSSEPVPILSGVHKVIEEALRAAGLMR
ncbi:PHB depolymerase family esterase [soil metagenome]